MAFRITVLCENSVGPVLDTLGEHGFAALVETPSGSILFDTGQGKTLLHNAERLNKNLGDVSGVVLSHGHYDHTGGLMPLLAACGSKEIFAHPGVFTARYRRRDTGEATSIGIPFDEAALSKAGARFNLDRRFRKILPELILTGEVPRLTEFEKGDAGLYTDPGGEVPDTFLDDQSLVINTAKGLVVLLGCCHAGLVNTLEHVVARTGVTEIYAVIGGTHLGFSSAAQLEETVKALRRFRIQKLCPSHCTGFAGAARLLKEFPHGFHQAAVGYTIEIQ